MELDNKYMIPSKADLNIKIDKFRTLISMFLSVLNISENSISISLTHLIDILIAVDRNKQFYKYFHNMNISQLRETALICYCILKKKPIIANKNVNRFEYINELFCVFLIFSVTSVNISNKNYSNYIDSLIYNFSNYDISIESMFLLISTIQTFKGWGSLYGLY